MGVTSRADKANFCSSIEVTIGELATGVMCLNNFSELMMKFIFLTAYSSSNLQAI